MLRPCKICGENFYINPAAFARGKGRYCSFKCSGFDKRGKPMHRRTKSADQHFYTKTDFGDGCWNWMGTILHTGYGVFSLNEGRYKNQAVVAHRYSYEKFKGSIPYGFHVDHLCRNRRCVNPGHLEAVTPAENVLRGFGSSANNARKTSCKRGHAFTPKNTRIKEGARICRICQRAWDRAEYQRRKYSAV